jgi:hypothetical protein
MQDGATPHAQLRKISEHCAVHLGNLMREERNISKVLWPPDINPCDFYLWGKLKSVLYAHNPHDLEPVQQNIRDATNNIQQRILQRFPKSV